MLRNWVNEWVSEWASWRAKRVNILRGLRFSMISKCTMRFMFVVAFVGLYYHWPINIIVNAAAFNATSSSSFSFFLLCLFCSSSSLLLFDLFKHLENAFLSSTFHHPTLIEMPKNWKLHTYTALLWTHNRILRASPKNNRNMVARGSNRNDENSQIDVDNTTNDNVLCIFALLAS